MFIINYSIITPNEFDVIQGQKQETSSINRFYTFINPYLIIAYTKHQDCKTLVPLGLTNSQFPNFKIYLDIKLRIL